MMWMLICVAILEYAKDTKTCLSNKKITLKDVLEAYLPPKVAKHVMGYCDERFITFHRSDGSYRSGWEKIENDWLAKDKNYKFNGVSIKDIW